MSKALDVIKKVDVELSLTPMIDVTFLLLIFFMVTAKFKSSEGKVQAFLPKDRGLGTGKSKDITETRIKILWMSLTENRETKDKKGRAVIKVGKRIFGARHYREDIEPAPDFQELLSFLVEEKGRWNPAMGGEPEKGMPVIIDARTQVPWKYIVRTLNTCLDAGLSNVTFAAAETPME